MEIAGGLYRELCEIPAWNMELGSGGRAAAAVSAVSPSTTLYTYSQSSTSEGISFLEGLGVRVCISPAEVAIAFAYFHPLSRPHIEPPRESIKQERSIDVMGETVLRFGFLEGDAVVRANRAIYDPQTSNDPSPFAANGSKANKLALVMNEQEVRIVGGAGDIAEAARGVIETQHAAIVVVKAGTRGALVFDLDGGISHIPAYRSSEVFKIGTGDVFSAMFAFYWGEQLRSPSEAADMASRSVAAYCSTRNLPLKANAIEGLHPIRSGIPGTILLEGSTNSVGKRYVMEEARYRLDELGATVVSPDLSHGSSSTTRGEYCALLLVADGSTFNIAGRVRQALDDGIFVVVLNEERRNLGVEEFVSERCIIASDFASALYFAVWAAMPQ